MRTLACFLVLAGFAFAESPKVIETFTGRVIGVSDGDTVKVLKEDKTSVTVRLEAIDAPESGQAFGTKSHDALSRMVHGKNVTVNKTGTDRYGRTLGFIVIDDIEVNATMIEDGWAWHYKEYSKDENLAKLEDAAKSGKKGLWADSNHIAPWEYRARKKLASTATTKQESVKLAETPMPTESRTRVTTPPPSYQAPQINVGGTYWLNTSSGVRHNTSCEYYRNTKNGRACGASDGRGCKICGG